MEIQFLLFYPFLSPRFVPLPDCVELPRPFTTGRRAGGEASHGKPRAVTPPSLVNSHQPSLSRRLVPSESRALSGNARPQQDPDSGGTSGPRPPTTPCPVPSPSPARVPRRRACRRSRRPQGVRGDGARGDLAAIQSAGTVRHGARWRRALLRIRSNAPALHAATAQTRSPERALGLDLVF